MLIHCGGFVLFNIRGHFIEFRQLLVFGFNVHDFCLFEMSILTNEKLFFRSSLITFLLKTEKGWVPC